MQAQEPDVPVPGEEPEDLNQKALVLGIDLGASDQSVLLGLVSRLRGRELGVIILDDPVMDPDDLERLLKKLEPEPIPTTHISKGHHDMNDWNPRIYSAPTPQLKYHQRFQTHKVPKLRPRGRGR